MVATDNPWGPWPVVFLLGVTLAVIETIATLAMVSFVYRFGPRMATSEPPGGFLPPFKPRYSATTSSATLTVISNRRCVFRLRLGTWSALGAYFPFKGTITRDDGQAEAVARLPVGIPLALAGWLGAWTRLGLGMLTAGPDLVPIVFILLGWLVVAGLAIQGWRTERQRFATTLQEVCDHLRGLAT